MAQVVLNIDGDASGAVAATGQAAGALSSLAGSAAGVDKAFTSFERTGSGIRATTAAVSEMAPAFVEAAGGSAQLGSSVAGLSTGLLAAGATANPLAQALIGMTAVASNMGPIMDALGLGAAKVAPPMTEAQMAAKDATLVFGQFGGGAGVARGSVDQLAAALLNSGGGFDATSGSAASLASRLIEASAASDLAGESYHVAGSAAQYLEMSQQQAAASGSAMVGSLAEVSAMAQAAGMSYSQYASIIGTQTVSEAPSWSPPARASGGPVSAGHPYIVGEQGPELFMPNSSGAILPSGSFGGGDSAMAGGGGITVIYNQNGSVFGTEDLKRQVLDFVREAVSHGLMRAYIEAH